jgi:DNA-binding transcriptional ArsR family regulator
MSTCSYVHMTSKDSFGTLAPAGTAPCAGPHLDPRDTTVRKLTLMPGRTVEALADTFRVLGDPTRVRILDALAPGELCVCDIASLVGISESAVSHQLRVLRGMRLVRPRRAGRLVYYAVDDHHILELLTQALRHVEEARAGSPASAAAPAEPLVSLPHRPAGRDTR